MRLAPSSLLAAVRDPAGVNVAIAHVVPTLAGHRYLLLTTTRRDGTTVGTPVWFAADGDVLVATTQADAWKVKRLRREPQATVAPCDVRGKPLGAAVDVVGEIVSDDAQRASAGRALAHRYGTALAAINAVARLAAGGRRPQRAVLALRPAS